MNAATQKTLQRKVSELGKPAQLCRPCSNRWENASAGARPKRTSSASSS